MSHAGALDFAFCSTVHHASAQSLLLSVFLLHAGVDVHKDLIDCAVLYRRPKGIAS